MTINLNITEPLEYKVLDNVLPEDDLRALQHLMLNPEFPWYYNPGINYDKESSSDPYIFQFTHTFYDKFSFQSAYAEAVIPLLSIINPVSLIRVKANLNPISQNHIEGGYHTDYDEFVCTTAVFYLNNNNGYTKFKSGEIVESMENRLLVFPSTALHTGASQTDVSARVVINLNYFEKK
jgi:hypothetical protein